MPDVLPASATPFQGRGPFRIRGIRPGRIGGRSQEDPVLGPLARVDHAMLDVGTVVQMHEHRNDEILSYLWRGTMVHEDSTGQRATLTPRRLMMMNAGQSFFHEESAPEAPVEMLQIFIRPKEADLEPGVHFHERPETFDDGQWHLIGGPEGSGAALRIRNRVWVYDAHPKAGATLSVPAKSGLQPWVYLMDGSVTAGGRALSKGDAITDAGASLPELHATSDATVVAFLVDPDAPASRAGSHSGYSG